MTRQKETETREARGTLCSNNSRCTLQNLDMNRIKCYVEMPMS